MQTYMDHNYKNCKLLRIRWFKNNLLSISSTLVSSFLLVLKTVSTFLLTNWCSSSFELGSIYNRDKKWDLRGYIFHLNRFKTWVNCIVEAAPRSCAARHKSTERRASTKLATAIEFTKRCSVFLNNAQSPN